MAHKLKVKPRHRGYDAGGPIDTMSTAPRPLPTSTVNPQGEANQVKSGINQGRDLASAARAIMSGAGQTSPGGTSPYSPSYPGESGPMARGGRIKHTSGPRVGRDDGMIPAQKGEYVVRKAAVKKLGTRALNTINKGKLPTRKGAR